jgi:hypothetical protein
VVALRNTVLLDAEFRLVVSAHLGFVCSNRRLCRWWIVYEVLLPNSHRPPFMFAVETVVDCLLCGT